MATHTHKKKTNGLLESTSEIRDVGFCAGDLVLRTAMLDAGQVLGIMMRRAARHTVLDNQCNEKVHGAHWTGCGTIDASCCVLTNITHGGGINWHMLQDAATADTSASPASSL